MKYIFSVFVKITLFSALLQTISCQHTSGKVFVLGGATDDNTATIYNALREATGKTRPNIVVAISAAPSLAVGLEAYNVSEPGSLSYHQLFVNYGFNPDVLYLAIDNYVEGNSANTTLGARNIAIVESADVIFFNGGDQSRHSRAWLNNDGSDTDIMQALRVRFANGAVIAGTSAGCAIQSDPMFGSGRSYGYYYFDADLKKAEIDEELIDDRDGLDAYRADVNGAFMKGFGFLQGALLDSHFDARGRFGRLIVAMAQSNLQYGFGVDEDTAIYFYNGTATVYGTYGVWVVDSSNATFANTTQYFDASNVKIHYLSENDTYSITSKEVTSTKSLITNEQGSAYESKDIFALDEALSTITTLVSAASRTSVGISKDKRPTTRVTFYKGLDTKTKGYFSDRLYTIDSLFLDIGTD